MFADDLLLFGKATEENMHCVINTLDTFCRISGQMVSLEKTSIYFSKNVPHAMRTRLTRVSGFKISASMGKYLGVPLLGKCPRRGDFNYLVEKVRDKLSGWKAKHLSFAGRVTLSKSVIQAIPIYTMMTTLIPKSCLSDIQRLQRGFIWGDTEDSRRMHMVKWSTLTLPKSHGGLGIRDLPTMNRACLMKLAWGVKTDPSRLWYRVLDGKYGRGTLAAGNLQVKVSDSPLWKAIHSCSQDISSIEAWSLGNDSNINLWKDKWINENIRLIDHAPLVPAHAADWCVSDAVSDSGVWDLTFLRTVLPAAMVTKVLTHPAPLPHDGPDERYWPGSASGNFSVALAYRYLCNYDASLIDDTWKRVWQLQVPERTRCFIWQILHGKLATKEYCGKWGNGDLHCHQCRDSAESLIHVLRDCKSAINLWNAFIPPSTRSSFYGAEPGEWITLNLATKTLLNGSFVWCDVWASGCYHLWLWRNREVHDDDYVRPLYPARVVLQKAREYESAQAHYLPVHQRCLQKVEVRWKAPPVDWIAVNTDGAVKSDLQLAGCGGVLRDVHGCWLGGFTKRLYVTSAYLAELWGAFEGLRLAISKGFSSIELQMDSSIIVTCLNGNDSGSMAGRHLLRRIRQLIATFAHFRIVHIYREANKVADALANIGCNQEEDLVVLQSPTSIVKLIVDADVSGVSTPRMIPV